MSSRLGSAGRSECCARRDPTCWVVGVLSPPPPKRAPRRRLLLLLRLLLPLPLRLLLSLRRLLLLRLLLLHLWVQAGRCQQPHTPGSSR